MEYNETIEPTTIARRLMEIREQLAEQLGSDLQQIAAENARLQADYHYEASVLVRFSSLHTSGSARAYS